MTKLTFGNYPTQMIPFLAILWMITCFRSATGQIQCHDDYSCALTVISDNRTTGASDIECFGYNSCSQSPTIETGAYVKCYGSFSCYKSTLIRHLGTSYAGSIECHGLYACASVGHIYQPYGFVFCFGEKGCYDTTITQDSTSSVGCHGVRACAESTITFKNTLFLYGYLAAQNSIIYAGDGSIAITMSGFKALDSATVVCQGTCTLSCASDGCSNINMTCADGDGGSCNPIINCNADRSLKSDLCPDGIELPLSLQFPDLSSMEFSTLNNSYHLCNDNSNTLNCDDFESDICFDKASVTQLNGDICCSAYDSCSETLSINSDGWFRADGYKSSDDVDGTITANTLSNINYNSSGDIYFSGGYANRDSTITGSGYGDLIASGYQTLSATQAIMNVNNLYCLTQSSCEYTTILNVNGNIYGYATSALRYTTVTNVKGDIYCAGSFAGLDIDAINVTGNVVGVGWKVMANSYFMGVDGVIAAYGEEALSGTTMESVNEVICEGSQGLSDAQIRGINRISVDGEQVMDNAVIVSEIAKGNTFVAFLSGTNTARFDIYCNETNFCNIFCQTSQSCTYLNLHCVGPCYVDCDTNGGFECPNSTDINGTNVFTWNSNPPTTYPSNVPSNVPTATTRNPSFVPTNIPTLTPTNDPTTNDPTNAPSSVPTSVPSNVPSNIPTDMPSSMPSSMPSDVPSSYPSSDPTGNATNIPFDLSDLTTFMPTNMPHDSVVAGTTSTTTTPVIAIGSTSSVGTEGSINNNNDSSNNKSNSSLSDSTIIIIVATVVCGIVCLCFLLFVSYLYFLRLKRKDEISREIELKKLETLNSMSNVNSNDTYGTNHTNHTNDTSNGILSNKSNVSHASAVVSVVSNASSAEHSQREQLQTTVVTQNNVHNVQNGQSGEQNTEDEREHDDELLYGSGIDSDNGNKTSNIGSETDGLNDLNDMNKNMEGIQLQQTGAHADM